MNSVFFMNRVEKENRSVKIDQFPVLPIGAHILVHWPNPNLCVHDLLFFKDHDQCIRFASHV